MLLQSEKSALILPKTNLGEILRRRESECHRWLLKYISFQKSNSAANTGNVADVRNKAMPTWNPTELSYEGVQLGDPYTETGQCFTTAASAAKKEQNESVH